MKHMEDLGYAPAQTAAERERMAFQMGYQAGVTDERMRQWREADGDGEETERGEGEKTPAGV